MILGKSVLLDVLKLEDEVLGVFDVYAKSLEYVSDEDFTLYYKHEFWLEIVIRHVELLCFECLCRWINDLGLHLGYIYWKFCGVGKK